MRVADGVLHLGVCMVVYAVHLSECFLRLRVMRWHWRAVSGCIALLTGSWGRVLEHHKNHAH